MIITIDHETYYDDQYSLSKISETDYIMSHLFESIMCSFKLGRADAEVCIGAEAIADRFAKIERDIGWNKVALLSHNIRFDGAISRWLYGVRPRLYLCTLSMARALTHIKAGGSSLEKVSNYLGLPPKGSDVTKAKGKRLEDFGADLVGYAAYCLRDNENCYSIYELLRPLFPTSEILVCDTTARMFIEPQVKLNPIKLTEHLADVKIRRAVAFDRVSNIDRSVFSSSARFTALLESEGVEVPMKVSPATGELIPALAKNDRGFKELCDDEDQPAYVQALLAARIGAKSTLEETRTQTLLGLSYRNWGVNNAPSESGWMPVPLKYYGAHTGRHSGDGGYNFLNLKRGSPLRNAIEAPPGMRIVHRDSSQIEARMVAWLARCHSLLTAFRDGRDVYCEFGTKVYGRQVTKADVGDRFCSKTAILGLGYSMGAVRFRHTLFIGNGGMSLQIPDEEAERIVRLYRAEYPQIPDLWQQAGIMLKRMIRGDMTPTSIPAISFSNDCVWLPNGMPIQYPGLREEAFHRANGTVGSEIVYDGGQGRGRTKLFGGKTVENVSQALARIVVTDIATRIRRETTYQPFLTTYDSLDYCVPENDVVALDMLLDREFAVPPTWALDLPLASEGGYGKTLLDAERRVNT